MHGRPATSNRHDVVSFASKRLPRHLNDPFGEERSNVMNNVVF